MDLQAAEDRVRGALAAVDHLYALHDTMHITDRYDDPELIQDFTDAEDEVRTELYVARAIADEVDSSLAPKLNFHREDQYHGYAGARGALVDLAAHLSTSEEIAAIIGPSGPRLSASALHPLIWEAAAQLWDKGFPRQALQTAAQALEGYVRSVVERPELSGARLAPAFATDPPTAEWPRLRIPGLMPGTEAWTSGHNGAGALLRASFQYVRNLASHEGAPEPTEDEALEQLAVLSMAARLVERCHVIRLGDE